MKDLFKKCHEPGGYFSVLREMRDRYFVMPKIEGSPGRVIRSAAVKLFLKSGECAMPLTPFADGRLFAKFWQGRYASAMSTMNISLPDSLKAFVDDQVSRRGYGTSSEYVRELIRKDQDRLQLRNLLLEGATSKPTKPVDDVYFESLRGKARTAKRIVPR